MGDSVAAAAGFYLDPFGPLLRAMVRQEGGEQAFIRAVQCSPEWAHITTFEQACAVACKTIRNHICEYQATLGSAFRMIPTNGVDPWTQEQRPRRLAVTQEWIRWFASRPGLGGKNTGWAPLGAENDPKGLNTNWAPNVIRFYEEYIATIEGEGG